MPIRIALLHHRNPDITLIQRGKDLCDIMFAAHSYKIVDTNPDILLFISGGSEMSAIDYIENDRFPIMVAGPWNNAWAAATEVLSLIQLQGKSARLYNYEHPDTLNHILEYIKIKQQLQHLSGQKIALIGTVSDWLVNSSIEPELLKKTTGLILKKMPWDTLPDYADYQCPDKFLSSFTKTNFATLKESGKVYALFNDIINKEDLRGITVECFSLVTRDKITACLPLALINTEQIPAACEGDIVSLVGMKIIQAITGSIPWMANTVMVHKETVDFAHCTVPLNFLKGFHITTHYETGEGTSIKGSLNEGKYTLIRFNSTLTKVFLSEVSTLEDPKMQQACRTQITFNINKNDAQLLREKPLGNHHLILSGHWARYIEKAANVLSMETNLSGCPKVTW